MECLVRSTHYDVREPIPVHITDASHTGSELTSHCFSVSTCSHDRWLDQPIRTPEKDISAPFKAISPGRPNYDIAETIAIDIPRTRH